MDEAEREVRLLRLNAAGVLQDLLGYNVIDALRTRDRLNLAQLQDLATAGRCAIRAQAKAMAIAAISQSEVTRGIAESNPPRRQTARQPDAGRPPARAGGENRTQRTLSLWEREKVEALLHAQSGDSERICKAAVANRPRSRLT